MMKRKLWATLAVLAAFAFGLTTTSCRNPVGPPPEPANIVLSVTAAHGFGSVYVDYHEIDPITVMVTNTGGQPTGALTVALTGDDYDSFTVYPDTLPGIPAGESATFTVGPDLGLGARVHTATVTVSGGEGITARGFDVTFTVSQAPTGTPEPTYGISLDVTGNHPFAPRQYGDDTPRSRVVTVTNTSDLPTGVLTVALDGNDHDSFTVTPTTIPGIPVGESATFTVSPDLGLAARIHTATVTVSGGEGITARSFTVSFEVTVEPPPPMLSVYLSVTGTLGFGPAYVGYAAIDSLPVTVTNDGNQATGELTVALDGDDHDSFTATPTTIPSIPVGESATFTVGPVHGLARGTHTATVAVSGDGGITASFVVSFTVEPILVTFQSACGTEIPPQELEVGEYVTVPTEPTRSGYNFVGWFTAETGGTAFDFVTTQISATTTIWARWSALPRFTVTFNSDGGSAVTAQTVVEGYRATKPTVTMTRVWDQVLTAGLWSMPLPALYIFGGWQHGGELWDFETDTVTADKTLTATWTAPSPIELDLYGTNLVSAAVEHVNANPGAFTLAIGADVQSGRNELYAEGAYLTIIGLGGRQEIQFTDSDNDQRLFIVGRSGTTFATLRLGNDITLVGRDNNANDLVWVRHNGHLYMEYGAWITGHSNSATTGADGNGAAVHVSNSSRFTMRGGRIFGNTAPNAGTNLAGGVLLNNPSTFIMTGGSIRENTRGTGANVVSADVMTFARQGNPFTMSGDASIYRLTLNHSGTNDYSFISIGPNWTGSISRLDLRRSPGGNIADVVSAWINATIPLNTRGVLEPTGDRTLNDTDLGNILAVYFLGNAEATNRPFVSGETVNYEIALADNGARGAVRWTGPNEAGLWIPATRQRVSAVPANDVTAAVDHVNDNANTGPFTLVIDQNVTAVTRTLALSSVDADLTIVGIGGEREISRGAATGRLFDVAASGARLTLGENITLRGNQFNSDLVRVGDGGRFYMEDGSQITGHANSSTTTGNGSGAAVNVGNYGTFTMSGGKITGNTAASASTNQSGGVFMLNANSHFIMTGGRIYGNHRGNGTTPADVFVINYVDHFTLSGDARIDRLILGLTIVGDYHSFITVGSDWSGGVAYLDLRANSPTYGGTRTSWTGNMVLQAAEGRTLTTADVGRIDWNTARFIGNTEGATQLVSQTSRIVLEDGVGVLRANP